MAVPSTNTNLTGIQTEFGGSNPIQLSEYYSGGPLVPSGAPAPNGPIPGSGQISIGQFRGSENITFMSATGGTITESGDFKIHQFTGPGTFTVNAVANVPANQEISYLVIAGGAGGGLAGGNNNWENGGGGGAGGFRESISGEDSYLASPKEGSSSVSITSTGGVPVSVGGGGSP